MPLELKIPICLVRNLDRSYDWSTHAGIYLDLDGDFWENSKRFFMVAQTAESLQPEQKCVYDAALQQYERIPQGESPLPLRLNVDGPAGTGKSYVIAIISAHLQDYARIAGKGNPVFRATPTGVAEFNIKGRTLHSLFRLPVKKAFTSLSPTKDCQFLIIDEKPMIGLGALHRVDQRLRQIFPTKQDEWFGGLNVLLLGDFCQLPPVLERALYHPVDNNVSIEYHHGKRAYESFTATDVLTQVMRQQGDDEESHQFRQALNELRNDTVTEQNWKLLLSRTKMEVGTTEVQRFVNAPKFSLRIGLWMSSTISS
jgi:ATP-dependent DNA helicase PIF1